MQARTAVTVLRDILVPKTLVASPTGFGGRAEGDFLRGDLRLAGGRAVGLAVSAPSLDPRIVLPALVEAHCHLDKCHTIGRLGPVGGDLATAIAAQSRDRDSWTEADLRMRAARGIDDAWRAGTGVMRTHIDWGDGDRPPLGWSVLTEMARADTRLDLQCAPLLGIDRWAEPATARSIAATVARDGGALGAFVLFHDHVDAGLRQIFSHADRHGLALDFHVDESLGDYNGLEAICDIAIETGFAGPILCGHAVSLIDKSGEALAQLTDKLLRAGVSVCALPSTNLYLQGRASGTPDRRGITRLREMHGAGVPVIIASGNVGDAFCPVGRHDPAFALHLAILGAHLDPPLSRWLAAITSDAARAIGRSPVHIDGADCRDLRLWDAGTLEDLVAAGTAPVSLAEVRA